METVVSPGHLRLSRRTAWLIGGATLALLLLAATPTHAGAIISDGSTQLGINTNGRLGASGGGTSANCGVNNALKGQLFMHHVATNDEAMDCDFEGEGWGVAYNGATTGWSYDSASVAGSNPNLVGTTFTSTSSTATVITHVGQIKVTHFFHPVAGIPGMFAANITLENQGPGPVTDLLYRRVMSWGSAGKNDDCTFGTIDTIPNGLAPTDPGFPTALVYTSSNGYAGANPLSSPAGSGQAGPPTAAAFHNNGPQDQGNLYDLKFPKVNAGVSREFTLFYGSAPTEAAAFSDLVAASAQIYSLQTANTSPAPCFAPNPAATPGNGSPATFYMGFARANLVPPPATVAITVQPSPPRRCLDAVFDAQFNLPPPPPLVYSWSFDGIPYSTPAGGDDAHPSRTFTLGPHTADLTVRDADGNDIVALQLAFSVANCPPVADFGVAADFLRIGEPFRFGDSSTDSDSLGCGTPGRRILDWSWDFLDGTSTAQNPVHSFPTIGPHDVSLVVHDCDGLTSQLYHRIVTVAPDRPPVLEGLGTYAAFVGSAFHLPVVARDPDLGQGLTLTACELPQGTFAEARSDATPNTLPAAFSSFDWDSSGSQGGAFDVCVQASDGELSTKGYLRVVVLTPTGDVDKDGVADPQDNCPAITNADQADTDNDGVGNACDDVAPNSPPVSDPAKTPPMDTGDRDHDGIADLQDNCVDVANQAQLDLEGDGLGDACDLDLDGDAIVNAGDNCPLTPNPDQHDADADGLGDRCDPQPLVAQKSSGEGKGSIQTGQVRKSSIVATVAAAGAGLVGACLLALLIVLLVLRRSR